MPTIKGPLNIAGGDLNKLITENVHIKLPFTATGWKSERNAELVTGVPVDLPAEIVEKVVENTSPKRGKKRR